MKLSPPGKINKRMTLDTVAFTVTRLWYIINEYNVCELILKTVKLS